MSVKVQISLLEVPILFADGGFRQEHLGGSKPAFHRSVWNELEVLRLMNDLLHGKRP